LKRYHRVLSRLFKVIRQMEGKDVERDYPLNWEVIHASSCSRVAQILARKRGIDVEMAAIAAAVHDYGRIVTGKQQNHAEAGFEPLKEFLINLGIFTDNEIQLLTDTCRRHSNKHEVGNDLEEVIKDSDVLDCHLYGEEIKKEPHKMRLNQVLKELGIEPDNV